LQAFESYLITAVGGIEVLQQQMAGQTEDWAEARNQLAAQGVAICQLGDVLGGVMQGVRDLQLAAGTVTQQLGSQQEGELVLMRSF
jgi:hypothetical protein